MTYHPILILLLIQCSLAYAQDSPQRLDSLQRLIASAPVRDTATVNLRNKYIKQALFANPADSTLMDFARTTLKTATEMEYPMGMLVAHECLALIEQYAFSNPYRAVDHYHMALAIAENIAGLNSRKWAITGNIATLYYEQEEYGKALDGFRAVLHGSKDLEFTALANIANVFGALNQPDSAIRYYRRALAHRQSAEEPAFRANLYSNLSLVYANAGEIDSAVSATAESLSLVETHGIGLVRPTAYANAAMAYLKANDYGKARHYAEASLASSERQGNLFLQKSAWGTLADVFAARGEYRQALEAHQRYSALKDSLNNQNRRVEINRKQMAFDFEKERAVAQAEIERQATAQSAYIWGGSGLLVFSVFGFILYKRRRDALAQKKEAELNAQVLDTELKALRSQLNPHFIFNSLNSIGDYITKNDNRSAKDYLIKFAKLMRAVLENSEHDYIPLCDDLAFLELYLQVETKRLPGRFSYTIDVDDRLDTENTLVPPLLLQPFVENSIWHGFKGREKPGQITVSFRKNQDLLLCTVDDDGIGRQPMAASGSRSLGIALTENRIRMLNAQKKAGGTLEIIDKADNTGTRVEVSLPFETAF